MSKAWWEADSGVSLKASSSRVALPKSPQSQKASKEQQAGMVFERYQRKYWQQRCLECNHKWLWPCDKKTPLEFCPKCRYPWSNPGDLQEESKTEETPKEDLCPKAARVLPHRFELGKCSYCGVAWGALQAKKNPPKIASVATLLHQRTPSEMHFHMHQAERNEAYQRAILDEAPSQATTYVAHHGTADADGWPRIIHDTGYGQGTEYKKQDKKVVQVDRFTLDCP